MNHIKASGSRSWPMPLTDYVTFHLLIYKTEMTSGLSTSPNYCKEQI